MGTTLQKVLSLFRVTNTFPILYGNNTFDVPTMDTTGAVFMQNVINGPNSPNLMLAVTDNTDNQATTPLVAGVAAPQAVVSRLYGYDGAGNNWDRLRVAGNNADAVAVETIGVLKQAAALYGFNGATFDRILSQANNGDAVAVSTLGVLKQAAFQYQFNETTFERTRGNSEAVIFASAVRSATVNSVDITNYNGVTGRFFFNITAVPGVDTVTLSVNSRDPASGAYAPIITGVAQSGIGLTTLQATVSTPLPRTFRITVTHSGVGAFTYSIGASLMIT